MRAPLVIILDRLAEALPGWLFISAGMAIFAAAVLLPARASNGQLAWQRDVLQHQADQLAAQCRRYSDFHDDLVNQNPLLLERLAYSQLHYQPVDGQLWPPSPGNHHPQASSLKPQVFPATFTDDPLVMYASVESYLAEPVANMRPAEPPRSKPTRLTRLLTGLSRIVLMVAALALVLGGVGFGSGAGAGVGEKPPLNLLRPQ